MPANITPVDAFTTTITIPTDGDSANGTEVALTTQALANRSENNNSRLNDIPQVNTVTNYLVPILGFKSLGTTNSWVVSPSTGNIQDTTANARVAIWDVQTPAAGSTIDSFTIYINNAPGRAGLPGTMPTATLQRINKVTGVPVSVSSQADTSGGLGAYESDHTIADTGIAHTVLANEQYQILMFSEDGANALPNLLDVVAVEIGWTIL